MFSLKGKVVYDLYNHDNSKMQVRPLSRQVAGS